MGRMQRLSPNRAIGERLPIVNYIKLGWKQAGAFPKKSDEFLICMPQQDPEDKAGNRLIDEPLRKLLLERQEKIAPELPSDKLRAIEVFLAPIPDEKIFNSGAECWHQYKVKDGDKDRTVRERLCRGDGVTATWLPTFNEQTGEVAPRKLYPGLVPLGPVRDDGVQVVQCNGMDCILYGRMDATGRHQVFPRCGVEWTLLVQIRHANTGVGLALLDSGSASGMDQIEAVIRELEALRLPGGIGGVPLVLRLKNERNSHGRDGAWVAYLDWQGNKLALINGVAQERKALAAVTQSLALPPARMDAERPAPQAPPADAPQRRERPGDVDDAQTDAYPDEDVEEVEAVDDQPPAPEPEVPPAPEPETPPDPDPPAPAAEQQQQPPAKPAPAPGNGAAPSPLWQHARALALELQGGDEPAADALLREALDGMTEIPRPTRSGKWEATPDQAQTFEDALRGMAEVAA